MKQIKSTETIYQHLTVDFWTNHHCKNCQQFFTKQDYHFGNYYLTFWKLTIKHSSGFTTKDYALLDEVVIYLFHHHCPLFKTNPLKQHQAEEIKDTVATS